MYSIKQVAEEYGVKNIRVFIPMPRLMFTPFPGIALADHNNTETVVCEVDESRYAVADNYKITFRALDPMFGYEHFYISDFNTLVREHPDTYRVYIVNIDGYQQIQLSF